MEATNGGSGDVRVRGAEGNVLFSRAMPALRVQVAAPFQPLGSLLFQIYGVAEAEIVYFADVRDRRIERAFHGQFEHFLEHTEYTYNYAMPNSVRLGEHEYMYDTHVYNAASIAREEPESDSAQKDAWLASMGYAPLEWTVSTRFVRLLDDARRHEVLLIYGEALDAAEAEALQSAGSESARWKRMEDALHKRALEAFTIVEG